MSGFVFNKQPKIIKYSMLTLVDFADFGFHGPAWITSPDLAYTWQAAQEIVQEHSPEQLRTMLQDWELCLNYHALTDQPLSDAWYARALLCIAIMGILGDRSPRFSHRQPRD